MKSDNPVSAGEVVSQQALPAGVHRKWNAHFWALAFFSFLILFSGLHHGDLSGQDDALYAHEAKQMILTGDWWNVRFNGQLNFEYPPLFLWVEALSMKLWGFSDFAAKFPVALFGLGTIILLYFVAFELTRDVWLSLFAMLALLSTQYFMKYATHAMTDVPCAFFVLLAIFAYVKGLRNPSYLALSGFAIGLAILTRSVVGLLPFGIIFSHLLLIRRYDLLWSRPALLGLTAAILVPSIWFVPQYWQYGDEFIAGHFSFIGGKISSGSAEGPALYGIFEYGALFLRHYWPWLPLFLLGLGQQMRRCRSRDTCATLLVLWTVWIIGPFSLAEGKIFRYLMPVFPACALLAAMPLNAWISPARKEQSFRWIYAFGALAVLYMILFPSALSRAVDMKHLAPIAEAHSDPADKVSIYVGGRLEYSYNNQFLWYANRYSEMPLSFDEIKARVDWWHSVTVIMDRASFEVFHNTFDSAMHLTILGVSEGFVCFRAQRPFGPMPLD